MNNDYRFSKPSNDWRAPLLDHAAPRSTPVKPTSKKHDSTAGQIVFFASTEKGRGVLVGSAPGRYTTEAEARAIVSGAFYDDARITRATWYLEPARIGSAKRYFFREDIIGQGE